MHEHYKFDNLHSGI